MRDDPTKTADPAKADPAKEADPAKADPSKAADPAKESDPAKKADPVEIDWRTEFRPKDEADAPVWDNLAQKFTTKEDLAKKVVHQERAISQRVPLPKEDDPPEKWDELYTKLGRPQAADEYGFEWQGEALTESEQAVVPEFQQLSHRIGLSKKQYAEIVNWDAATRKVLADAGTAKASDRDQDNLKALRVQWGNDYDDNAGYYEGSFKTYMSKDDFSEFQSMRLADGSKAANHPVFARMGAKIGRERVNDDWDVTPLNQDRKQNAEQELAALQKEIISNKWRPGHPDYPQQKLDDLYKAVGSTRKRSPNDRYMTRGR